MKQKFPIREIGHRFGEWTVLKYLAGKDTGATHNKYLVKCSCGTEQEVTASNLENKLSTKCRLRSAHVITPKVVEVEEVEEEIIEEVEVEPTVFEPKVETYNENIEVKYNSEYMSYKEFHKRYCPRYESLAGVINALKSGTPPERIVKNYFNYTKRKGLV